MARPSYLAPPLCAKLIPFLPLHMEGSGSVNSSARRKLEDNRPQENVDPPPGPQSQNSVRNSRLDARQTPTISYAAAASKPSASNLPLAGEFICCTTLSILTNVGIVPPRYKQPPRRWVFGEVDPSLEEFSTPDTCPPETICPSGEC